MKHINKRSRKRSIKISHKKSLKNTKSVLETISNLNNLLLTVKLYHWTSDYFNIHKITDSFLKVVSPLFDKYVEVYLGGMLNKNHIVERKLKNKFKKIIINPISNKTELKKIIDLNINILKTTNKSIELDAVSDEIVSELQKFKYLLNFK